MRHRAHVYIICYGKPTVPAAADLGLRPYPVLHYVGYTGQYPPVKRVWAHGRGSGPGLVEIRPGNLREELRVKLLGKCPRCGKPLWYYRRKPVTEDFAEAGLFINPKENHMKRRLYLQPARPRR